ncbi:MAG: hypothetical protein ACT6U0_23230 [Shinella sp.]|uniref:hypothetical protein n=1 Tax=Shinella sp. TaxID=1870904 RepID=UPI0040351B3C
MKITFPRLTAAVFDAMFDPKLSKIDRQKALNDALDVAIDAPLRHINVDVNDAMLAAGVQAALEVQTYGEPDLYAEECIYRAFVAMRRVRLMQQVIPARPEGISGEE